MYFSTTVLTAFAALATLAQPAAAAQHRIRWRHAGADTFDTLRWLITCQGKPYGPPDIGTPFSLSGDYVKYCSPDWTAVKDKLAPIYTGGEVAPGIVFDKFCIDATLGTYRRRPTFPAPRPLTRA